MRKGEPLIFKIALAQSTVPDGRLFALDQQMLISVGVQLLNFVVLAVILGWLLYKPVRKYLAARTQRISGQLEDAQQKMAGAEELKAQYEAQLREIEAERARVLEAARLEAAEQSKQILAEARSEADAIRRRAEESTLQEKEKLQRETWQYIVEVSSLMTEKLVQKAMDSEAHQRLFDDAMAQLEETPWPR